MHRRYVAASAILGFATVGHAQDVSVVREATAAGPEANAQAGIQSTVDAFRADLGDPNNGNAVGSQGTGRRQITWDGGDNDSAPARLPADYFNAIAPRGVLLGGDPRIQFQISADSTNATATPIEFGNVNATYPTAFSVFSSPRLFSALNNNVMDVQFVVPGTLDPATVSGFGAVFTDVDTAGSSMIEFFDAEGSLLFSRDILATPGNESLSFLGVLLDAPVVHRVRITAGGAALGPNDVTQGGTEDIVVLDDFIYGEPIPIPDSDGDGTFDPFDGCPDDAAKTDPGACGCGESDADSDADGVPDCFDHCAGTDDQADADGDGICDALDLCTGDNATGDSDSDGVCDSGDICPGGDDSVDTDADGTPDACDDTPGACCGGGLPVLLPLMLLAGRRMGRRRPHAPGH